MLSTSDITYVPSSYIAYGNNGLSACYNNAINSSACAIPGSEFSFEIRDALHNFSDHLPVTLTLEADVTLSNGEDFQVSNNARLGKSLISLELVVYISSPELFNQNIVIYNHLGQIVDYFQTNSNQRQSFNISNFASGIYYLDFIESNTEPLKFVVSN